MSTYSSNKSSFKSIDWHEIRLNEEFFQNVKNFKDFKCQRNPNHKQINCVCLEKNCSQFLNLFCEECQQTSAKNKKHNEKHLLQVGTFLNDLTQKCDEGLMQKEVLCDGIQDQVRKFQKQLKQLEEKCKQISENLENRLKQTLDDIMRLKGPAEQLKEKLDQNHLNKLNNQDKFEEFLKQINKDYIEIQHRYGEINLFVKQQEYSYQIEATVSKYMKNLDKFYQKSVKSLEGLEKESTTYQKILKVNVLNIMEKSNFMDSLQIRETQVGKVFCGTNSRFQSIFSSESFEAGRYELEISILRLGNGKKNLYVGLIKDGFEKSEWPVGGSGCNMCVFSNFLHQIYWTVPEQKLPLDYKKVNNLQEGDKIILTLDMDNENFQINLVSLGINLQKSQNFLLENSKWRFFIGWYKSSVQVKLKLTEC